MINQEILTGIIKIVGEDSVLLNERMSEHTSFRIGGPADVMVMVKTEEELAGVLQLMTESRTEHLLIGNGSNYLVADSGYPGVIIKMNGEFEWIELESDNLVVAGAARLLSQVSAFATENSLTGFEFASGIPGSVGGAMFMNAGAYGGEMKDIVKTVRLMRSDGSEIMERSCEEMQFAYRNSSLQEDGSIVLSATFKLEKGDRQEISDRVAELQKKRNDKQPVNYPSAGSTFKRPAGGYAAALIDEAGLRGTSVGGAQVSEKHAGFIINTGDATAEDVLALMRIVRDKVKETSGITLEPEVRLINCEL